MSSDVLGTSDAIDLPYESHVAYRLNASCIQDYLNDEPHGTCVILQFSAEWLTRVVTLELFPAFLDIRTADLVSALRNATSDALTPVTELAPAHADSDDAALRLSLGVALPAVFALLVVALCVGCAYGAGRAGR